jgi:hypothetical protein
MGVGKERERERESEREIKNHFQVFWNSFIFLRFAAYMFIFECLYSL